MLHWILFAALRLTLRLELGPEYDTNANRAEVLADSSSPSDRPVGSALLRTTVSGTLLWRRGSSLFRLKAGLGSKIFFNPDALDQTVLVGQVGIDEQVRVGTHAAIGLATDYYDAWQPALSPGCNGCARARDFRSGSAGLRLTLFDLAGEFELGGGYRGFEYKPDLYFDFQAPTAELRGTARWHVGASDDLTELALSAGYQLERRFYSGLIQSRSNALECAPDLQITTSCLVTGRSARADWFHALGLELSYLRSVLVAIGYGLQLNQSNSFGQSLLRHVITLKVGFRLPFQLFTTLKGQLLASSYLDPVLLSPKVNSQTFVSIEDENRNALVVDVERPLPNRQLSLNARYSLYTNELSHSPSSFLRQVIYLGLTYRAATP